MRELNATELAFVSGGGEQVCTPDNSYGGISNPPGVGDDLIAIYEGVVAFTSHVIERVALAL